MVLSDLQPRFQRHDIIQRQITRKWYKIELYLHGRPIERHIYCLSNGAIFNDLERRLNLQSSRSTILWRSIF